ncbi:MAG: hypothetical protein KBT15_07455 [Bacteroidales bacterium]|nr:hypothetical protein [Candidatus Minthousia equi]
MEKEGIVLDLQTIIRLREEFRELSKDLRNHLGYTEDSIEQVSHTWEDDNFQKFYAKFNQDKERIEPLFQRVDQFEQEFLNDVELNLREYLSLQDDI